MQDNSHQLKSRGRSYKNQDFSGRDFSNLDIRGADFTGAILIGANFSQVKAGLQRRWIVFLIFFSFLLSALSGFISSYVSTFIGAILFSENTFIEKFISICITFLVSFCFLFTASWKGITVATGFFVLAITTSAVLILAVVPGQAEQILVLAIIQPLVVVGSLAGITVGALIWCVVTTLIKPLATLVIGLGALIGTFLGVKQGIEGVHESLRSGAMAVAGLLSLVLFIFSVSIGEKASAENDKYLLIRRVAIFLATLKGTSFRGANLTDANFSAALLKHTDLREINLTRTFWLHAKKLNQALAQGTYLANPKIRDLVVTGSVKGKEKNFDYLDLRGINLQSANLRGISFVGSNLSEANLRSADLSNAQLIQTQLYCASLTYACLTGACIQNWGISSETKLEDIKCEYVYMRLKTEDDDDPWRKPDNWSDKFQEGDFSDFVAPIIKTLDAYRPQAFRSAKLDKSFKPLDFYHKEGIDPSAVVVALKQLQEEYPEAELEVVALYGPGEDKVRIEAKVSEGTNNSELNAKYFARYRENILSPSSSLQSLLARLEEKDDQIKWMRSALTDARTSSKFYIETQTLTTRNLGDNVSEQGSINVNTDGGNFSGFAGNLQGVSGVVNLGEISGNVSNAIGQLPNTSEPNEPSLKELLVQLQMAINEDATLQPKAKAAILEQVKVLAEAGQEPENPDKKGLGSQAVTFLKGASALLPDTAKLVEACSKLLPLITKILGLPF